MKVKKTRRQKRKLLIADETEANMKSAKMLRSEKSDEESESADADFIADTMPTRATYREQLEIGFRNRLLVLLQVTFLKIFKYMNKNACTM